MSPRAKEWIINGFLLAGIVGLLVLIALGARRTPVLPDETEEPAAVATPVGPTPAPAPPVTVWNPKAGRPDPFPNLGALDIFRPCITPAPTPTRAAATPLPAPSLERVTHDWEYQYPVPRKGIYIFLDTKTKVEHQIPENEWTPFMDPATRSTINVRAKPKSKREVDLEGVPAGGTEVQTVTKSL